MYETTERSTTTIKRTATGGVQRGTGEALDSYINRIRTKLDHLERVCEVHFAWYTHRNVAGCWICDTLTTLRVAINELERTAPFIVEGTECIQADERPSGCDALAEVVKREGEALYG